MLEAKHMFEAAPALGMVCIIICALEGWVFHLLFYLLFPYEIYVLHFAMALLFKRSPFKRPTTTEDEY